MIISILAFILVLGVLVVLHEAGHFLAARAVGAPVEVFSVGFGKRLWGFDRGGTEFRVSLIPLGGYVRIPGLGPDESHLVGNPADAPELLARWKRALILVSGPLTNLVGAVLFLAVAFMIGAEVPAYQEQPPVVGWVDPDSPAAAAGILPGDLVTRIDGTEVSAWRDLDSSLFISGGDELLLEVVRGRSTLEIPLTPQPVTRYAIGYAGLSPQVDPVVTSVQPRSPAAAAGLQPGDRIVAVDGVAVRHFYDLVRLIAPNPGKVLHLTVVRDGNQAEVEVTPEDQGGEGKIGVSPAQPTTVVTLGPVAAVSAGAVETYRLTRETFKVLKRLLTFRASLRQVSGPIDIARISGEAARGGPPRLIWFMGLISLQLGIFNLLPIPVLDGGHLAIVGFEAVRRRDLSVRLKERILEVGFYAIMLLMVVVLVNDIVKILPESLYRFFVRG